MAGKYVINGAILKCPLCTGSGTLHVTSNQIQVQDQACATTADKGKQNLIFAGVCKKFPKSPPPCIAVISPLQWKGTASDVSFNGNYALLEGSSITCATGGVSITIADTTQKAIPTNLDALSETGAPIPSSLGTYKLVEQGDVKLGHWLYKNQSITLCNHNKEEHHQTQFGDLPNKKTLVTEGINATTIKDLMLLATMSTAGLHCSIGYHLTKSSKDGKSKKMGRYLINHFVHGQGKHLLFHKTLPPNETLTKNDAHHQFITNI